MEKENGVGKKETTVLNKRDGQVASSDFNAIPLGFVFVKNSVCRQLASYQLIHASQHTIPSWPLDSVTFTLTFNDMPWYNRDYPPSYKNQPIKIREKAVEIANALLEEGAPEGIAIATGLKRAREFFKKKKKNKK